MADTPIGRPLVSATYWQVDQGIWSPRDQRYGWREWDTFDTQAKARKAITALLKDQPDLPLLLTQVRMVEVWNEGRPAWDTSPVKAEANG